MTTKLLICEGRCNPQLPDLDEAVRVSRKWRVGRDGDAMPVDDDMAAHLRRLRHTPHELVGGKYARCVFCDTPRQAIYDVMGSAS